MSFPPLYYLAVVSYVLPLPAGIVQYRTLGYELKILFYLLVIGLITDLAFLWPYFNPKSAPWLIHVYIVIEFILLMAMISSWQESRVMNRFFLLLAGLYSAFWIIAKGTFEPFNGVFNISGTISGVLITLSAGYSLFLVIEQKSQPLLRYDRFWILISLVVNFTGSLLPILFAGIVYSFSAEYLNQLWSITWIATILSHALFMIGFLCQKTRTS